MALDRLVRMAVDSAVMTVEDKAGSALDALCLLSEEIDKRIAREIPDVATDATIRAQEVLNA